MRPRTKGVIFERRGSHTVRRPRRDGRHLLLPARAPRRSRGAVHRRRRRPPPRRDRRSRRRRRAAPGSDHRPGRPRPRGPRRDPRVPRPARARVPLLLRRLRDRVRPHPRRAAAAGGDRLDDHARARLRHRGRARRGGHRAVRAARGLGHGHDGTRDADPVAARRGAARHAARAVRARRRRGRRVRAGADRHAAAEHTGRRPRAGAPARRLRRAGGARRGVSRPAPSDATGASWSATSRRAGRCRSG